MVEKTRRAKQKRKLLGNHQKCWIWGRHAVVETLQAKHWPIIELRLSDSMSEEELTVARSLAEESDTPYSIEPVESIRNLCHSGEHQGYAAKMTEFPYANESAIFDNSGVQKLAILDGIQDPYNFGSIIRSASVLGIDALIVGTSKQCAVTSFVARTSVGAVNHVPIVSVADICGLIGKLKTAEFHIYGTAANAEHQLNDFPFNERSAIIIGNEGRGVSPVLIDLCDQCVRIPQQGPIDSLNAAISASIIFYEMQRADSCGTA